MLVAFNKTTTLVLTTIFFGIVLVIFCQYNPAESALFIPCPFHALTGLHCPGCGSQRALHQLVHLNIWGAFKYNSLLVLSIPILMYSLVTKLHNYWYNTKYRVPFFYNNTFIYTYFGIVVLFWVLRNIPIEPFTYLAPTTV
ncbi:MAG: hypothetical protein CMC13_06770 [Flavobacteriaceae bacterium]|nr:hypothetical protein [Flavobacteriaceae bacterium]|tara:strand:- start:14685 stop:15107 length:423 start_codon:yes stop_codon:yes gene_type:complete